MKEVIYNFLIHISKVILFFKRLAVKRRIMRELLDCFDYVSGNFYPSDYLMRLLQEYHDIQFKFTKSLHNKVFNSKK